MYLRTPPQPGPWLRRRCADWLLAVSALLSGGGPVSLYGSGAGVIIRIVELELESAVQMFRTMADIPRMPEESWLQWHMMSWCASQTGVLLKEGGPLGTKVLCQAVKRWAKETELDTRCALPRVLHVHSQRYLVQTRELYATVGLAREMRRRRIGGPRGRCDAVAKGVVAEWLLAHVADRVHDLSPLGIDYLFGRQGVEGECLPCPPPMSVS